MRERLKRLLPEGLSAARAVTTRVGDADAIMAALAERIRELVPASAYSVRCQGRRVTVTALNRQTGTVALSLGVLGLQRRISPEQRIEAFFADHARALQEFMSEVEERPWPNADAQPHARVDEQSIRVWYGPDNEEEAVLRWRSFQRQALGL
jgi:hypothetical protein